MKLRILLILCLSCAISVSSGAKKKPAAVIGIGCLQVSPNLDIPLYEIETGEVFDTLKFSVVESGEQKGKFMISHSTPVELHTLSYYPGDSQQEGTAHVSHGLVYFAPELVFRVVALTDHGYIVLLNEEASKKAEIRHDEAHKVYDVGEPYWNMRHHSGPDDEAWFLFETWETYLKRMMYVRVPESDVYDSPKGKKITIDIDGGRVTEMDGKWIRIVRKFYDGHESEVSGWVRWTDGRQMLVKPVAEVYY